MEYTTVYEIATTYFPMYYIIPFVLLVLFVFLFYKLFKLKIKNALCVILPLTIVLMSFLCVACVYDYIDTQNKIIEPYFAGEYKTVAGVVENFDPLPQNGNGTESFEVNGIKFDYSKSSIAYVGYNIESSAGGYISKNGQNVRIKYIYDDVYDRNLILKLEILNEQ